MTDDACAGEVVESRTFSVITLGKSASRRSTLRREDIALLAAPSGDVNRSHVETEHAPDSPMHEVVARHAGASLLSAARGTLLLGPRPVFVQQALRFPHPVRVTTGHAAALIS